MYLDLPGQMFGAGHESAGVTAPATEWFLAEGATGPYFDLFVLIANPGQRRRAGRGDVPAARRHDKPHTVAANSRFNIWVDCEDARLADTRGVDDVRSHERRADHRRAGDVVAGEPGWYEAHNSPGATTTGTKWALAEGEVGGTRT